AALLELARPDHPRPASRDVPARVRDPPRRPGREALGLPPRVEPHRRDALEPPAAAGAGALRVPAVELRPAAAADYPVAARLTSAASRSATRSSADSIPTDSRTRLAGGANGASAVDACVMRAGCSIMLSTPPSDSAS